MENTQFGLKILKSLKIFKILKKNLPDKKCYSKKCEKQVSQKLLFEIDEGFCDFEEEIRTIVKPHN